LLGRGLCDGLITRPEESYRLWCVVVCDLKTSRMRGPWPTGGCRTKNKQTNLHRTTKGLGHITIHRSGVRSWCKSFGLKSYSEHCSHIVRCFQTEVRKYEYQTMVKKGFIMRALIVTCSNISLEFNCPERRHVFLHSLQDTEMLYWNRHWHFSFSVGSLCTRILVTALAFD